MITEQDLQAAIAECQGTKNPNANTCIKLAAFLTIRDYMYGEKKEEPIQTYSFSASPETVEYDSGTEFSDAIYGRNIEDVLPILDELMETIKVINPRLYAGVMRKLQ